MAGLQFLHFVLPFKPMKTEEVSFIHSIGQYGITRLTEHCEYVVVVAVVVVLEEKLLKELEQHRRKKEGRRSKEGGS